MIAINSTIKPMNVAELEAEIREVIGDKYQGLSIAGVDLVFWLSDEATEADQELVSAIYEAHDPAMTDQEVEDARTANKISAFEALQSFDKAAILASEDPVAALLDYIESMIKLVSF